MKFRFIQSNLKDICTSFAYHKVTDVMRKVMRGRQGNWLFLNFIFQMEVGALNFCIKTKVCTCNITVTFMPGNDKVTRQMAPPNRSPHFRKSEEFRSQSLSPTPMEWDLLDRWYSGLFETVTYGQFFLVETADSITRKVLLPWKSSLYQAPICFPVIYTTGSLSALGNNLVQNACFQGLDGPTKEFITTFFSFSNLPCFRVFMVNFCEQLLLGHNMQSLHYSDCPHIRPLLSNIQDSRENS